MRAAALGALLRAAKPRTAMNAWHRGIADASAHCRRRAVDLTPTLAPRVHASDLITELVKLLEDQDVTVIEAAAWALGELGTPSTEAGAVEALARTTNDHPEPIAREAAVAALGALGDERGLQAILKACTDKPPIRRRAVLALAPYEGKEVEAALKKALDDRDWQVRQAAEDLLSP